MSEAVVSARGLGINYGSVRALEDVTFELPAGVSVALLGPNGSGKSTLLEAIAGLLPPSTGSIGVTRDLALVPQRLDIERAFPITVRDVVRMGRYPALGALGRFRAHDHELVDAALAELDIGDIASRRFGTLSGGQRQRALLAQALAQDADLLLLDEPFTGVDAPTGTAISGLLADLRSQGRTVVVATHDLASAARDYDLVLCLNRRLIAFGPPSETCTEQVLAQTFEGRTVRVGGTLIDVAHHHEGAG